MTRKQFLQSLTNGLYTGDEKGSTGFNALYTLRNYIMQAIDIMRQSDKLFDEWYSNEFANYERGGTRFCNSPDMVFIGRIDDGADALGYTFDDLYKVIINSKNK